MSRSSSWVRRHVTPIGLDFGTRVVRMIQLAQQGEQLSVVAAAERSLPAGQISPSEREELAAQAVSEMIGEKIFSGKEVITALGWDDLHARNLRIPQMPEDEIGQVIRFEAAERFGLDPMNSEISFLLAGDVRQGTEVKQEVIAFGAGQNAIDRHISTLTRLQLDPVSIDAVPCAIFRSFERFLRRDEDVNSVNVFVDLGYIASRVIVTRGSDLIFFKSIPIGGLRFDELTAEQLDLTTAEAAELRYRIYRQHVLNLAGDDETLPEDECVSTETNEAVLTAVRPGLEQLSREISLCLRYCSVTFRGVRSDGVTAIGGEACNRDVLRVLSDQVNVPFEIGKVTRNMGDDGEFRHQERRTGQPEWASVVGLALKPVVWATEVAS